MQITWRAYFSFKVLLTDSSTSLREAGQREVVTPSRAYICSFFFKIWSYCALRWWYAFTL